MTKSTRVEVLAEVERAVLALQKDEAWPQFGPGIGPGRFDPGRTAARAAYEQAKDEVLAAVKALR